MLARVERRVVAAGLCPDWRRVAACGRRLASPPRWNSESRPRALKKDSVATYHCRCSGRACCAVCRARLHRKTRTLLAYLRPRPGAGTYVVAWNSVSTGHLAGASTYAAARHQEAARRSRPETAIQRDGCRWGGECGGRGSLQRTWLGTPGGRIGG